MLPCFYGVSLGTCTTWSCCMLGRQHFCCIAIVTCVLPDAVVHVLQQHMQFKSATALQHTLNAGLCVFAGAAAVSC